jgi:DNA-directed RNA polymerase subunit E"
MATGPKACKHCKALIESGSTCPQCGSTEISEHFKGKVSIINPEQSELAKNLKIHKKGVFAIKLG